MNLAQTCYYIKLNIALIYLPADLDTTKEEEIHLFSYKNPLC